MFKTVRSSNTWVLSERSHIPQLRRLAEETRIENKAGSVTLGGGIIYVKTDEIVRNIARSVTVSHRAPSERPSASIYNQSTHESC